MTKIVYNACYGGFSLSTAAKERLAELGYTLYDRDIGRTDPRLLQVIDELGLKACSGSCADLAIAELPAGTKYRIDEYDGNEQVCTPDDYEWHTA